MSINVEYYGTLGDAYDYFANRLHETAWSAADIVDRPKALWAATQIIDTLNYKGYKAPVWTLLQSLGLSAIPHTNVFETRNGEITTLAPTMDQIRAAEASQALEFPRGSDTEVPSAIQIACYEIAHSLLDGKDPELELENLGIISQGYSSVRTTYQRTQVPIEHLINGVPNAMAWRLIRPFLRDGDAIKISRIS